MVIEYVVLVIRLPSVGVSTVLMMSAFTMVLSGHHLPMLHT